MVIKTTRSLEIEFLLSLWNIKNQDSLLKEEITDCGKSLQTTISRRIRFTSSE